MNVHISVLLTNSFLKSWFQSPAKAVYNARHWNQPEPEEIPVPPLSRSQTAPVRYYYIIGILCGFIMFFSTIKAKMADCKCVKMVDL